MALAAVPAGAVTVQVDTFSDAASASSARDAFLSGATGIVSDGFEAHASWNGTTGAATPLTSAVGLFRGEGAVPGSGKSSVDGGTSGQIRADVPLFGRRNLSAGGANWLDSNDLESMVWEVGGAGTFDSLSFFLTDVGDIAGTDFNFTVAAAGSAPVNTHIARQSNGTINFVRILFDAPIDTATVTFISRHNDGFGLDDATVATVPLPAGGLLLLGGLAGFAALRRRN
jgi:hypothetical protein